MLQDAELDSAGIREAGSGCCRESCSVLLQTQSKDLAAKTRVELQAEHPHSAHSAGGAPCGSGPAAALGLVLGAGWPTETAHTEGWSLLQQVLG